MRRAVLTLGGTVAGLAALFSFKTHVPGVTPVAEPSTPAGLSVSAPPTTSPTATASPSASASPSKTAKPAATAASSTPTTAPTPTAPATTQTRTTPTTAPSSTAPTKKPTTAPTTPKPTPTKSSGPSGTFTGPAENTEFGEVQVQITVSDGKITNAAGSLPQGGDGTAQNALPPLNSEVLQAQSANIQAVSGATYTSNGYIASLQQAVDQAGL
jgi:uncharacterized protein with FMN-binding domain